MHLDKWCKLCKLVYKIAHFKHSISIELMFCLPFHIALIFQKSTICISCYALACIFFLFSRVQYNLATAILLHSIHIHITPLKNSL